STVRTLLALALVAATMAFTPAAAHAADAASPPFPAGSVGVVGCSNTAQHVQGYLEASALDQMPLYPMGGLSIDVWGDSAATGYAGAWDRYDDARPATGYHAAWVMLCIRVEDVHDPNLLLTHMVSQIRLRDPGIPVYVSPLNAYEEGHVCSRVGVDGVTKGAAAVEWGIANLAVQAGPVTGPLTLDLLAIDGCHLNGSGIDFVGDQLVAWFDEGGSAPDITPPTVPMGLTVQFASGSGVQLSWSASTDDVGVDHYRIDRDGVEIGTSVTTSFTDVTAAPGTRTYVVLAVDGAGNISAPSSSVAVRVQAVSAQFTVSSASPVVGTPVTFTDAHPGSHRRVIMFGDGTGTTGRTQTYTKTYTLPGLYTATLDTVSLATGKRAIFSLTVVVVAPAGIT
ncbi:MAG: hypothetical protein ABWY62_07495, partial [Acidimicrobiia bacterium]